MLCWLMPVVEAASGGIYWLASYPKSGNTWFRTFLANFQRGDDQPVDINALNTGGIASNRGLLDELLALETSDLDPDEIDRLRPLVHDWEAAGSDTVFQKTHDAYGIGNDGTPLLGSRRTRGALYFIRNPLDVAISYAHHNGSGIDKAIEQMGRDNHGLNRSRKSIYRQVRQHMGTWSQHVLSWVDAPALNAHVMRYEDMHSDGWNQFARAVTYLGLALDEDRLARALRFSEFNVVKQQEAKAGFAERPAGMDGFFRKGKVGDWRGQLSDSQIARIITDHGSVMQRFGYLDTAGNPL
jgi:hypothetical protein